MNRLKEEWEDQVLVIQLDLHNRSNRALLDKLDATYTPTFILYNLDGREVWRQVGAIDPDAVKRVVENIESNEVS